MSNRRDERLSMLGALPGEIMVFEPMTITELSRDGATIETRFALQLNSLHELRLTLGDRSVIVKGRVVHCRICEMEQDLLTYRSGMEFVEPSERVTMAIGEYLDSVRTDRRGV